MPLFRFYNPNQVSDRYDILSDDILDLDKSSNAEMELLHEIYPDGSVLKVKTSLKIATF